MLRQWRCNAGMNICTQSEYLHKGESDEDQVGLWGAVFVLEPSMLLVSIPGDSCFPSPTPIRDALFELGFVKEAVNKLDVFPLMNCHCQISELLPVPKC